MIDYKEIFERHSVSKGFSFSSSTELRSRSETLMFNISGGVPLEQEIAGLKETPAKENRQANTQLCLRTDGWHKIGNSGRHHLAFTMLGHFMLDATDEVRTKLEMLLFALEYMKKLGINREAIYCTAHPHDLSAQMLLRKIGFNNSECTLDDKLKSVDPLAKRAGYRVEYGHKGPDGIPREIWNIVFHQFDASTGRKLNQISGDSGASLERLAATAEGVSNNYLSSIWRSKVSLISETTHCPPNQSLYRLADFMGASLHLLGQGYVPAPNREGYIARKITREMLSMGIVAGVKPEQLFLSLIKLLEHNDYKNYDSRRIFPEVEKERQKLVQCCSSKPVQKYIASRGDLNDEDIKYLKDTYGVPEALSPLMANKSWHP